MSTAHELTLAYCRDEIEVMILGKEDTIERGSVGKFKLAEQAAQRHRAQVRVLRRVLKLIDEQIARGER